MPTVRFTPESGLPDEEVNPDLFELADGLLRAVSLESMQDHAESRVHGWSAHPDVVANLDELLAHRGEHAFVEPEVS